MQILSHEYQKIVRSCPIVPPEVGGLLGSVNHVIVSCVFDYGTPANDKAIYQPSIKMLNEHIKQWQTQGIEFAGLFHSHPAGQYCLSSDDELYITRILNAMPPHLSTLYFPVVLPRDKMFSYIGHRTTNGITIYSDSIQLIDERIFGNG